ncbi:phage tail spike protein [Paenisporosarcina sp. OV554]|uniref:phage tail spike protein n=1 Tax=Paenisporosarcina sp. OV554 TaxID=2135694 RepID=UPI000D3D5756|nr:phage tail spike protein [Paenisporosarcina sp. OV554]PUB12630.1 phage minor structural protein [Paenisporosarcina sp. OV554]
MIHILDGQTDALLGFLDGNGDKVFWDDEIEQDVIGKNIKKFTMLSSIPEATHIKDLNRLLVLHERGGWQEFVIYEHEVDDEKLHVYGVGSESGMNRKVIAPTKHEGFTLKQYVDLATSGTEWTAGYIEYAGIKTLTFDTHLLPYDFLTRVETAFKVVELSFRVEIKGSHVIGRYVDAVERIGNAYSGKEFVNAKDLIGVSKKVYNDRIVTALHAIGPEREDGTRLTAFITDEAAFQRWNYKGLHIIAIYEPETEDGDMTLDRLTQLGKAALKKRIDSVVEYSISAVDLAPVFGHEAVYLGDSVRIKDTDFNPPLYAEARIINVKRPIKRVDEDMPGEKEYIIGEVVEFKEEDVLKTFRELQKQYGLRVIKSPTAPPGNSNIIWIKTDPSSTFEVAHTWDGFEWIPITPTEAADIGAETPEGALSQALELYLNIVNTEKAHTDNKYTSIYSNVDLPTGTAKTNLLNAKTGYNTAYTNLINSINAARVDEVTTVAEKIDVDTKYNLYRGALSALATRFEEATRAIEQEKTLNSRFYTWIKYADTPTTGMSDTPEGKKYLGIAYNNETSTESSLYADYSWSLIEGEKGDTGIEGPPGDNGESLYTWIKYADDANGNGISDLPTGKKYLGISYNNLSASESSLRTDYSWSLLEGPQGIQGPSGPNGQTLYTWLKYGDSPTTGMSDVPTGKKYIGLAYNKTTPTESSTYADYAWSLIEGPTGPTGSQGIQGPVGPNGEITYVWIKYADTPTTGITDSPTGKKYLGIAYNKLTQTESTNYADYSWSLIEGPQGIAGPTGSQGIQGPQGPQGQTLYTWLKYADSPTTGMNDLPSGKAYIGLSYNKTTATESTIYGDYTWSLIKGETGNTGVQGPSGPNGESLYTWIKYGTSATGAGLTDNPANMTYIGVAYNKPTITESTTAADYTWSLIQGPQGPTGATGAQGIQGLQGIQGPTGATGIQGPVGANGVSSYTHIAYATNATGTTGFSVSDPVNKTYIGMYVDSTPADSTNPALYNWSLIKGADGSQGIQGPPGANGQTSYLHIAYATNSTGSTGFSTTDPVGKTYIGTYTDFVSADSSNASVYAWSLIKGDTGATGPTGATGSQGVQGPPGANGQSLYTWIKYADTVAGAGMTDTPAGKTYIGLAYNKVTATESLTATDYAWSLIQGATGNTGADGVTYYTWVKYGDSASGAGLSDSPTGKTYIGLAYNKTSSTESTTAADYTWSLIKGDTGATGATGAQGPAGELNLINNPNNSGNVTGWVGTTYATTPFVDGRTVGVALSTSAASVMRSSDYFEIETNKMYEFSVWLKRDNINTNYFGITVINAAGANIGVYPIAVATGVKTATLNTNPYFWSGAQSANAWVRHVGYIIPAGVDLTDPELIKALGENVTTIYQFPGDADRALMRIGNYNNTVTSNQHIAFPLVKEVDVSILQANKAKNEALRTGTFVDGWSYQGTIEIDGGKLRADTVDAAILKGGTVIAGDIIFEGELRGATGTYSGRVNIGDYLTQGNVVIDSEIVNGAYVRVQSKPTGNIDNATILQAGTMAVDWYDAGTGIRHTSRLKQIGAILGLYPEKIGTTAATTFDIDLDEVQVKKFTTSGKVIVAINDDAITLNYPTGDNAYLAYTENGIRKAYVGYGGNGATQFTLQNDNANGSHTLMGPTGGHRVDIDTNGSDGHTRIRGSIGPIIKFLKTAETIQFRNFADSAYASIVSSGHTTVSKREYKKNISLYEGDGLGEIVTTPIREWQYNSDFEWEIKRLGIIVDEAPLEVLDLTGEGVDSYAMAALAWRAIQQLSEKLTTAVETIQTLEGKIQILEEAAI